MISRINKDSEKTEKFRTETTWELALFVATYVAKVVDKKGSRALAVNRLMARYLTCDKKDFKLRKMQYEEFRKESPE